MYLLRVRNVFLQTLDSDRFSMFLSLTFCLLIKLQTIVAYVASNNQNQKFKKTRNSESNSLLSFSMSRASYLNQAYVECICNQHQKHSATLFGWFLHHQLSNPGYLTYRVSNYTHLAYSTKFDSRSDSRSKSVQETYILLVWIQAWSTLFFSPKQYDWSLSKRL